LEVGKYYLLNAPIEPDSNLTTFRLIADKPDPTDPSKFPAVVVMGDIPSDRLLRYFILDEDAYFENIYFLGAHPSLDLDVNVVIELIKAGGKLVIDGCYFDWCEWLGVMVNTKNASVTVKNTFVKNYIHPTSKWNAVFISSLGNPVDTCILTNNTHYNSNHRFLHTNDVTFNYLQIDHNTIAHTVKGPPFDAIWCTNAKISNNLFYNAYCYGNTPADFQHYYDNIPAGLIGVDTLLQEHYNDGHTEAGRKIKVMNNNWFYSQEIKDYWELFANINVIGEPFFNKTTIEMFGNDAEWPSLIEENTRNLNPEFKSLQELTEMVDWMTKERTYQSRERWFIDPDGNRFTVTWPLHEDLSYNNAELKTGGQGGYPVGDLNWWGADKVTEWEAWYTTDVKNVTGSSLPEDFNLEQNYPNPFNPSTIISYSIPYASSVNISIYNSLGEKITTLVNQEQSAGSYSVNWSGKDQSSNIVSSGIYFYRIHAGSFVVSRKMILLR